MNCHEAQLLRHGYLDAELDAGTALQYEQHVHACPACAKALAEQKTLQTEMKADTLYYRAPEHLHRQVRASLNRKTRHSTHRLWRALVTAACLFLCVGLGVLLGRFGLPASSQERLLDELTAGHIRSLQWNHLVDVPSSNQHVVKPWFTGKLDFSPSVRIPEPRDFTLVGGRLDYLDSRAVAAVVYKRREHVINVFSWPAPASQDTPSRVETRQGYQLIYWCKGGMYYCVVSDLNAEELNELARRFQD
jgi:anti-sigma factor RsiW